MRYVAAIRFGLGSIRMSLARAGHRFVLPRLTKHRHDITVHTRRRSMTLSHLYRNRLFKLNPVLLTIIPFQGVRLLRPYFIIFSLLALKPSLRRCDVAASASATNAEGDARVVWEETVARSAHTVRFFRKPVVIITGKARIPSTQQRVYA